MSAVKRTAGFSTVMVFMAPIFISAIIALTVFTCSTQPEKSPDYVRYRIDSDPTTLDPAYIVDVTGATIAAKLFNGLVHIDEQMNVVGDIAHKWRISPDGRIYRFSLRQDIYFNHNNQKVTARDFEYSFKRILNPGTHSPNTWVLNRIDGAEDFSSGRSSLLRGLKVIDDFTLEITLSAPFAPFLKLLTMSPGYVVSRQESGRSPGVGGGSVISGGSDIPGVPGGTGPFMVEKWTHSDEVVLKRNTRYFENPARVGGITYRIIPEDLTAVTEFMVGNVDVLEIPVSAHTKFLKDPAYTGLIESAPGINIYYMGLVTGRKPLDNPVVRRAIAFAIDREKILDTYYLKRGIYAPWPVPDTLKKYRMKDCCRYDPEKARALLKSVGYVQQNPGPNHGSNAGLKPALKLDFYIKAVQESVDMAEIIASYLTAVGITVTIKPLEWSAYKAALNNGEADLFWLSWWADYPDAENFLFPLFHSSNFGAAGNRTRYKNPAVDELIANGSHETDEARREEYYRQAESIIAQDVPGVFFWNKINYVVHRARVKNFRIYPIYSIDKGTQIELSKR
jgi:peptide/nickel transport system substrate-binding protein/oligopeptide transport system substrate-binding protein